MGAWNAFRIMGDLSHASSKGILIFAIHHNRSAEGVSLITQLLYALVFCTRYVDLFVEKWAWNATFKTYYILSSFYILAIMQWTYPRTREREVSWKLGAAVLSGSLLLSPFAMLILEKAAHWGFQKWLWVFSEILESVCVLPQLLLLRQTTVPTVINSFYLLTLGSYRALYCLNWIIRETEEQKPDTVSVIFGTIQVALFVDFAWVYYTRQRVKLRGGSIVDADDMRRSWLLRHIFGKRYEPTETDDEESAPALRGNGENRSGSRPKWGARGISVSADDGVLNADGNGSRSDDFSDDAMDPDAKMQDPDDLAKALDDDDDEDSKPSSSRAGQRGEEHPSGVRGGDEWRD